MSRRISAEDLRMTYAEIAHTINEDFDLQGAEEIAALDIDAVIRGFSDDVVARLPTELRAPVLARILKAVDQ